MKKMERGVKSEAPRVRVAREYWSGEVQQWRDSGLIQKEYCKKKGISLGRFGAWKRRLEREDKGHSGTIVAIPSGIVSSALLGMRPTLGLVVNERYRVEIPDSFSPATLEAVLQVLTRL
ncbi:MAG: hypothetical protein ABSA46_22340 [Thermodesulfovibrionales bacterium]|jgi:hypothetical protein